MPTVTIKIFDKPGRGDDVVGVRLEFDPPLTTDDTEKTATASQILATQVLEFMRKRNAKANKKAATRKVKR